MRLTDSKCKRLSSGIHADGGGLYFEILASGSKRFIFRWTDPAGKRCKMALGAYPALTLVKARERGAQLRQETADGNDPRHIKASAPKVPTFGELALEYIEDNEPGWKHKAHKAQWRLTMLGPSETPARGRQKAPDYCAAIRKLPVDKITSDHVLDVLRPVWMEKPETARRILSRIAKIMDYAKARKLRDGDNPADKNVLKLLLPDHKPKDGQKHHPAMPFDQLPGFVAELQQKAGVSYQALEMLILTCLRSKEIREARLCEFDLEARVWSIPAIRMKKPAPHTIPLTDRMIAIVEERIAEGATDLLFAGPRSDKPIRDASISKLVPGEYTVHGLRSTFADWVGDATDFDPFLAEYALHHAVGNKVMRAYRRKDALDRRRRLMEAWEAFCLSGVK